MDQDENKNIDNVAEIDPDYECTNSALREAERRDEEENNLTQPKLHALLQEEFNKDLEQRQKQLEEIEDKIFKAQKLLHIVRYVIISSYYNNKPNGDTSEPGCSYTADEQLLVDQTRIHPQVKKLLGDNPNNLSFLAGRAKRKAATKVDFGIEKKKPRTDTKVVNEPTDDIQRVKIEPIQEEEEDSELITTRTKVQHRVVIGNISYYKKSLEVNNLTHKWMVYVKVFRGSDKDVEVTNNIVNNVVFYLHPSYRPHDVVDISVPPFHLSRRGWGEFPLRLKIFFKSVRNKPVDVIHQLKLDNTFKERQTLGNETTVPVFLYECESKASIKTEELSETLIDDSIKIELNDSYDHDYCNEDIKPDVTTLDLNISMDLNGTQLLDTSLKEHSYFLSPDKKGLKSPKKTKSQVKQAHNDLIYGLGTHYLEPSKGGSKRNNNNNADKNSKSVVKLLKTASGQSIRLLPETFNKLLLNNRNIVSVKLIKTIPQKSQLKSDDVLKMRMAHERRRIKLPDKHKFKNMGEALPYLFKRLPLWSAKATDIAYKCIYPFTAVSEDEFKLWNVGKRMAAEWSRAKAIKRLIASEPYCQNWNTKSILMYGRSHSYAPIPGYRLFDGESLEKHIILSCYKNEYRLPNGTLLILPENDETINITSPEKSVIDCNNQPNSNEPCVHISDKQWMRESVFIRETALDVGVLLKSEELVKGVAMNAAERIILEAVKCFADNLIRRANNYSICHHREVTENITQEDVRAVMHDRKEFEAIWRYRETKLTRDFFS